MKLTTDSIKTWTDIEKLFLARLFEDDTEILVPTLLTAKQKKEEFIKTFIKIFQSMTLHCPSDMTQSTLVETCHHNLQTFVPAQMGVRNVTLGSSWYYKANKWKILSRGSELKKKTANQD